MFLMHILAVGQLDQVYDRGGHESVDIASKIEILENRFDDLQTRIRKELSTKPGITMQDVLSKLTALPLSLRREYESSIIKRIKFHGMRTETQINDLFIFHLNLLTSFIDYGLIEYLIKKFGSDGLKKDMVSYCSEMIVFMKETTIKQLIDHLHGEDKVPPNFSLIEEKISEDPSKCTLEQLNMIKKRKCIELMLSEIVFQLLTLSYSNSFIVWWLIPSALISDVVKSAEKVKQSFYQECRITFLTLDGMWLYMSETEIDAMWSRLHVSDTKFNDQFHNMYKQIVYELEIAQITGHELSSYIEKKLEYHQSTCDWLSCELLNHELPVSFIDVRVLAAVIEGFGSHCLKSVMSSYCKHILSTFFKKSTAQQLSLSAIQLKPSRYSIVKCRIKEESSQYTLDKLFSFQTRFCAIANCSELCFVMDKINTEMSGSFTVSWLVPRTIIIHAIMYARNVDPMFYYIFDIVSLTLDGMWLYMNKAEIDAMWSRLHVSDTKFKDQLHTMCKQIVCEMEAKNLSEDCLSSYFQSLHYKRQVSDQFSQAVLEEEFPASFIDFGVLKAVIERFGSDCLKRVMSSYCKYMSIFTKESTAQQLIKIGNNNMLTIQSTDFKHFKIVRCKIMEKPSNYRLETLLNFRTRFCTTTNCSEVCFIMVEVNIETKGSFTVSWLVPQALIIDIMKSVRNVDQSFYQEFKITSLTLDGMWLHMSESEIDTMWSQVHVSNIKFKNQFCTMCKQIVCEMKVQNLSEDSLSSYFQSLNYQPQISDQLSQAFLEEELPASFVDFGVLMAVIEGFGSDCLKRVMESYCNYVSIFTNQAIAQQLINIGNMLIIQSTDFKHFKIARCKIMEKPSDYKVEKLLSFRTRFCTMTNYGEECFIMIEVNTETKGSFTVNWLVPPASITEIMNSIRNIDQNFYQEYKITSLTLDGMWIYYMNEAEIDAMWSQVHVSDTKFKDQFHTMCKQIVCEMKVQNISKDHLSSYFQSLHYQQQVSNQFSQAFLEGEFPASFIDFGVLKAVIKEFGSDCLKRVMESYSNYMSSIFTKESTAQQLINMITIQSTDCKHFKIVRCKIMEKPSNYKLETLLNFRTRFCTTTNFSEVCFIMVEVNIETKGSFTVSWLVPQALIIDIMKSVRNVDQSFYQEFKITSLTLDGMWIYMNEAEIDAMWSHVHVSDTKFKDQFHTMCKQIVCELKVSKDHLLPYIQSLNYQQQTSQQLSQAFLEEEFPASFIDFRVLKAVIEKFGSDCLKRVMESYCNYMSSIFTKESTAQQLINIGSMTTIQSTDFKHFKIAQCKIKEEPSNYKLETLFNFRTGFCTTANFSEVCFIMNEVNAKIEGSFIISWLASSAFINNNSMKSVRNLDQSFYQEYKITSLTLDGMWLHMSEAELEVMWMHMSSAQLIDQFQIIHKQIILELKLQSTPKDELSQCLMNLHPNLQKDTSIVLSETILTFPFSPSGFFLDFDMLSVIIQKFGSDCLRDVMISYCKFMSVFSKQLTVQQLLDLPPVPTEYHEGFIEAECGIMKEPSGYTCDKILSIKNSICAETDCSGFMLTMSHVRKPLSDSFFVSWLIPTQFASDLIESANRTGSAFYIKKSMASLSVGNHWVYNQKLIPFGSKLKDKYQQSQGSPSPVEWIPSPTKKIFQLPMIQRGRVQQGHSEDRFVQMTSIGRIDDILHSNSPVKLEDIFSNTLHRGKIILIEGAPGSGKSTLTVHICQRWGKGELFQQFTVVILVQLRDPAVQSAQTIADLLPVEKFNAEEIADELTATNGRGVLWVLDGWDELPPHLQQDSIFRKLLPPKPSEQKLAEIKKDPTYSKHVARGCSEVELWLLYLQNNPGYRTQYYKDRLLNETSIIVTSRPISSADLHPVVSSRIEVLGFTSEEQRQYFTECLKEDTKALEALLEKIQENPMVQSICYLPLNATFIVQIFKYRDQSLPNTEYEIYLSVILSCIQRHYDREGRGHDLPRELASLDDLSRSEPFQRLCELAYRGVMENKVTFSSSDLPRGSNTLSLLRTIESFLQSGKPVFYFLHLSIQEVLSAYYITTKLSDSEQVSQFQQLFNQPRFAAVFQFYAAITKLKSPGIRQVIDRIVEAKSKPLLVSLLRCLHEAQDPDLCLYVAERLEYRLDLSETSLSPLDCLSVSFFLFSRTIADKKNTVTVNLAQCQIGDLGVKCLTKYLSISSYADFVINLKGNDIHDEGASHVANKLFCIERLHLDISENPIGVTGTSDLFQAVRESAILKTLILIGGTIIADLLPVENAQEVATGLRATNGRGVLWILDDPQNHLHTVFLSPKHTSSNTEYSVIVTSCSNIDKIFEDESKPLLVSLLRCLHEAQNPDLCLYVAERLEFKLDLSGTSLSLLDCLSVSFFLSSLSGKEISVNLYLCAIGDLGAKCLSKYPYTDNKMTVDLIANEIHEQGALHIGRIIYFIEHLYLSDNPIGDAGASQIKVAVSETATLKTLILCNCGITSRGAKDLSRTLAQNTSLEKLDIALNDLGDDGISHMAEGLKQNKQLKELWIGDCGTTDKGAASLASALTVNNSLKMLHIGGGDGALTEDGLSTIAHSLANKSIFMELAIPNSFESITIYALSRSAKKERRRNRLPRIKIEGESAVLLCGCVVPFFCVCTPSLLLLKTAADSH